MTLAPSCLDMSDIKDIPDIPQDTIKSTFQGEVGHGGGGGQDIKEI